MDARTVVGGNLSFYKKLRSVLRYHFLALVYMVLLSACFSTMGHGPFDLYPTFLTTQRKLSVCEETWVTILLQSGGICRGMVGGYLGNRFSEMGSILFRDLRCSIPTDLCSPLQMEPRAWSFLHAIRIWWSNWKSQKYLPADMSPFRHESSVWRRGV